MGCSSRTMTSAYAYGRLQNKLKAGGTKPPATETQKEKIMRILNITSQEADEILACDKEIDRGHRVYFDLSVEDEKRAIKMANADTHKSTGTRKRTVKENPAKQVIMQAVISALQGYDNFTVDNPERKVSFSYGENDFEVTLTQKRKPK